MKTFYSGKGSMKNETLKLLKQYMDVAPDDLLDIDRQMCEAESGLEAETRAVVEKQISDMQAILADDTLPLGIRLGFVVSTGAIATALANDIAPSEVFKGLALQSYERERIAAINVAFQDLFNFGAPDPNAPECPECSVSARWCNQHQRWECPNPICPYEGAIENGD